MGATAQVSFTSMSRRWFFVLATAAALLLAACGSDTEPDTVAAGDDTAQVPEEAPPIEPATEEATPVDTPEPRDLPDNEPAEADPASLTYPAGDEASLEALLNPLVEDLGVRFTRGALVERAPGTYEASATGNHLALYVAPTQPFTDEEFVVNLWAIARVVTPHVFANFSGVNSYDICQEPYSEGPREGIPPPITQIDIDRTTSDGVDWVNGSLADLITLLAEPDIEFTMRVDQGLQQAPSFVAALAEAGL
jgi:hypothetical protein